MLLLMVRFDDDELSYAGEGEGEEGERGIFFSVSHIRSFLLLLTRLALHHTTR